MVKQLASNSLANLTLGRKRVRQSATSSNQVPPTPTHRDASTSMTSSYSRFNPSPAVLTQRDRLIDCAVASAERIDRARRSRRPRGQLEIIMLLQFILKFLAQHRCCLTTAIEEAARIFCWGQDGVRKIVKEYMDAEDDVPQVKTANKRGRGSAAFKQLYGDRFCVLKQVHLVEVLEYVRRSNSARGGMVTAGRVQAHLLNKFEVLFKKYHIYYALRHRLRLTYTTPAKRRIEFTPARKRATIVFCRNMDAGIKLERAGTHVLVRMDESYIHLNHRPGKTWNGDDVPVYRSASKGSLFILVHALTKDGLLTPDGYHTPVGEWEPGVQPTTEMIFRAKFATKNHVRDYHDTMDATFFMYWVQNRLVPAFRLKYPGKKCILVLDNAPYHHAMVKDGFRPDSMTKDEIVERLATLPRKRGVPKLKAITVRPYADNPAPPPLPSTDRPDPTTWNNFVFLENTGELWLIDGLSDQGHGEVIVYSRVGGVKAGATESTLVQTFIDRLCAVDHKDRWYLIGYGSSAVRWAREKKVLNKANKVPRDQRRTPEDVIHLRTHCRVYCETEKHVTYTYRDRDFAKRYNGVGFKGTGGPKAEWLRCAVNDYVRKHYPELQSTILREFFKSLEWKLLFTVPYWADSQPIEQVWAYVKNYVALRWFPGRKHHQTRAQTICGMYGREGAGVASECWEEPKGLKPHTGVTPELAVKFINKSLNAINECVHKHLPNMNDVGEWTQEQIDSIVYPCAGGMDEDEITTLDGDYEEVDNGMVEEIDN